LYARTLQQEGNSAAAERALQQAIGRFPVEPSAFLLYAAAAERNEHLDAARRALIQYLAVAGDVERSPVAARIGGLSLRLNDAPTAAQWFARALTTSPNDVRLMAALAEAQLRRGDAAAARATITRALETSPGNPQLLALERRSR
jgi:Flp pilus assembly protein TadD